MRFVADNNLGKLVRFLRIAGFKTEENAEHDYGEMIGACLRDSAVLLTRDSRLIRKVLKEQREIRTVQILSSCVDEQLKQVFLALGLTLVPQRIFTICALCNHTTESVPKSGVRGRVPPHVYHVQDQFRYCSRCGRYYWPGTHWKKIIARLEKIAGKLAF